MVPRTLAKRLRTLGGGFAAAGRIAEKVLVTAGETRQRRSGVTVLPWSAVSADP